MAITIEIADFVGEIELSANRFDTANFDSYIERYKTKYGNELLGSQLYKSLLDSTSDKYDELLSGTTYEYIDEKTKQLSYDYHQGFLYVLKYLIYFHIVADDFTMSDSGAVMNKNDNAVQVSGYSIARDRFNKAVETYRKVVDFIERLGTIEYSCTSTEDAPGVYALTIQGLAYIEDGDTITANGVEYEASNVLFDGSDTLFNISGGDGLTFDTIAAKPFRGFAKNEDFKYIIL